MKFISLYNIIIESRLDDYKIQLKDQQLAKSIFNLNNPKKQKMIIKWIKNGSIQYPKDLQLIDKVYQIINRKQLDYNKFNNPQQILDQYQFINNKLQYNPDNEPCFSNKVELNKGVVIYNVQDDFQGLKAVRRAVDYNWSKDANPWCLITPPLQTKAFRYWKRYNKIQKRICFKNGKLIAFCANEKLEIQWWDREDHRKTLKELVGVKDPEVNIYKQIKKDIKMSKISEDINELQEIYQKYKDNLTFILNLVQNEHTPSNILEKLANDKNFFIRLNVAGHSNVTTEILQKLSQNDEWQVRQQVALNQKTSLSTLQKLCNDEYCNVIQSVAKNPKCPKEILYKLNNLKGDKYSKFILNSVAKNPNCPIDLLQELSQNEDWYVRSGVAENTNTPKEILQKLIKTDESPTVIRIAIRKIKEKNKRF